MIQHVSEATHVKGHTLDVVITYDHTTLIHGLSIFHPYLCDHYGNPSGDYLAIELRLNINRPRLPTKTVTFRRYQNIDIGSFIKDVNDSYMLQDITAPLDKLMDSYQWITDELQQQPMARGHSGDQRPSCGTTHPRE